MKKLQLSLLLIFIASVTYSQKKVYQDDKLEVHQSVQKVADKKNDVFYEYYVLTIKNTSNKEVKFTPIIEYKNNKGKELTTKNRDETHLLTLAPGEEIEGHIKDKRILTLFKQFNVGNSGRRASETQNTIVTLTIKY